MHLKATCSFVKENWGLLIPLFYGAVLLAVHQYIIMSCGLNKTFFNPLFQALPFVLLMYSAGWFLPSWLSKCYFSFLILLSTLLTVISNFLLCVFNIPLTPDIYYVLAASSLQESLEFMRMFFNWKIWALLIFIGMLLSLILYLVWRGSIKHSKVTVAVAVALMLPYLINIIRFTAKDECELLYKRNLEFDTVISFLEFKADLDILVSMVRKPKLPDKIRKVHQEKKIVGILVIGESATRNHWGLYGYYRNTTPEIDRIRKDVLVFDDVITPYANTYSSCKMMFTSGEYSYQKFDYTVFSVLQAAGYKVFLISNQFRLGSFDGPVNILYSGLDRKEFMQEEFPGAKDGIILDRLPKYIAETDGPVLIIVHLIGSHGIYNERFPAEYDKFGDDKDPGKKEFSDWNRRQVNDYDNSILYTDHVLARIIEMVRKLQQPGYMLYLSDHGECPEVPGSRSLFSLFSTCYEIPMIFYGNEHYKQCFPDIIKAASENTGKPYMSDWLNYSIVSTAQVTYAGFPAEKDIFSLKYKDPGNRHVGAHKMAYQNPRVKKPFYVDKHGIVRHSEKTNGN